MDVNPNAGSASPLSTNYSPSGRVDSSMPKSFKSNLDALNASFPVATEGGSGSAFGGLMSSLLPSLIGSFGSTALNALFSKIAANRQYGMNKSLMDYQNQLQRDMLTDEMALKMQGYKNAGLSTASLAGNFGGNVAVPSSNVSATQAQAHDPRLGEIMNAARQVKLQEDAIQSQIDLNEANAEKARASAGVDTADAYLKREYGDQEYEKTFALMDAQTRDLVANAEKAAQDRLNSIRLTDQQVYSIATQTGIAWTKLPLELKALAADIYARRASGAMSYAQAAEAYQAVKESAERINLIREQEDWTDAQTDAAIELAILYKKQQSGEGYRNVSAKAQAELDQMRRDVERAFGHRGRVMERAVQAVNPLSFIIGFSAVNKMMPNGPKHGMGFKTGGSTMNMFRSGPYSGYANGGLVGY